jgi:hypothetical protein
MTEYDDLNTLSKYNQFIYLKVNNFISERSKNELLDEKKMSCFENVTQLSYSSDVCKLSSSCEEDKFFLENYGNLHFIKSDFLKCFPKLTWLNLKFKSHRKIKRE